MIVGLRLYPAIPLNTRQATKTNLLPVGGGEDGLSSLLIRKGEVVVIPPYVTSRRKEVYGPDESDFCLERWVAPATTEANAIFSINGGPCRCIADYLKELCFVIVAIL